MLDKLPENFQQVRSNFILVNDCGCGSMDVSRVAILSKRGNILIKRNATNGTKGFY